MRFRDIRIGVRINAGYAILIVLMLVVIVLAGSRIYAIRAETDDILHAHCQPAEPARIGTAPGESGAPGSDQARHR